MSTDDAIALYSEYQSLGTDSWGPFVHYNPKFESEGARLLSEIGLLLKYEDFSPDSSSKSNFSSAWHCVLYLLRLQLLLGMAPVPKHYVFRGHASENWLVQSTLSRQPAASRPLHTISSHIFSQSLRRLSQDYSYFCNYSARSALARHYGVPSEYIDWTTDPAVAVWFASNDSSVTTGMARVFVVDTYSIMRDGGTGFLPPPHEKRLFNQCALLAKHTEGVLNKINREGISCRFPVPDQSFSLYRDGVVIDPLEGSLGIEELVRKSARAASELIGEQQSTTTIRVAKMVDRVVDQMSGVHLEQLSNDEMAFAEYAFDYIDWLYWAAGGVSPSKTVEAFLWEILEPLVLENTATAHFASKSMRFVAKISSNPHWARPSDIIDQVLSGHRGFQSGTYDSGIGVAKSGSLQSIYQVVIDQLKALKLDD
ncbi:MAG: FRG domain-containing protein [Phycisphaerales bacterium]